MDEAVSIDMLPFLIAAIAGRKSLRQLIDETYSKNCIAYHDAALSSPYYNHLAFTRGRLEFEYRARKVLGIILVNDVEFVPVALKRGWKDIYTYVENAKPPVAMKASIMDNYNATSNLICDAVFVFIGCCNILGKSIDCDDERTKFCMNNAIDYVSNIETKKNPIQFTAADYALIPNDAPLRNIKYISSFDDFMDIVGFDNVADAVSLMDVNDIVSDSFFDKIALDKDDITSISIAGGSSMRNTAYAGLFTYMVKAITSERKYMRQIVHDGNDYENAELINAKAQLKNIQSENELLKTKLKALQAELDNTNRNLTRAVAENESHQNDATELAALREALYNMQYTGSDETSVEASSRELPNNVISVGGSQQWLTAMRDALPEVKFYSPDQLIPDSVIRSASEAWLNASAMSHSQFYAVISVVRKYNVPLHYYSHRGTVGCISDLLAN